MNNCLMFKKKDIYKLLGDVNITCPHCMWNMFEGIQSSE